MASPSLYTLQPSFRTDSAHLQLMPQHQIHRLPLLNYEYGSVWKRDENAVLLVSRGKTHPVAKTTGSPSSIVPSSGSMSPSVNLIEKTNFHLDGPIDYLPASTGI